MSNVEWDHDNKDMDDMDDDSDDDDEDSGDKEIMMIKKVTLTNISSV